MLTIFHMPKARSLRVLWLCEEMGVPYAVKPGSIFQPSPEFLAANPLGTIPAMTDGDVRMTESIAMMLYIMEKHGPTDLAVRPEEPAYPDFLQSLIYAEATAAAPVNALIAGKFMAKNGEDKNWTSDFIRASLEKRAAQIDARLKDREYIAGGRFTAADIATAYTLGVYAFVGLDEKLGEAAKAYQARMCARPAFQRAAAVQ